MSAARGSTVAILVPSTQAPTDTIVLKPGLKNTMSTLFSFEIAVKVYRIAGGCCSYTVIPILRDSGRRNWPEGRWTAWQAMDSVAGHGTFDVPECPSKSMESKYPCASIIRVWNQIVFWRRTRSPVSLALQVLLEL